MPKRRIDDDNPEWTADDIAGARPLRDVSPRTYEVLVKAKRGRPKLAQTKTLLTIRVGRDVINRYRATGKGWQTRMVSTIERAARRLPSPRSRRST